MSATLINRQGQETDVVYVNQRVRPPSPCTNQAKNYAQTIRSRDGSQTMKEVRTLHLNTNNDNNVTVKAVHQCTKRT